MLRCTEISQPVSLTGSKRESASLGLMSALASCGHNRANSFDAPKARRKLVTSVALTDTSLALSPGFASGLFLFAHSTNRRALAGWGSSSTRAQSPPHSVWGDREAAVRSMLSLILWRLSNALVTYKVEASSATQPSLGRRIRWLGSEAALSRSSRLLLDSCSMTYEAEYRRGRVFAAVAVV